MKILLLSIFALIANSSFAQSASSNNEAVTDKFIDNYNSESYSEIFSMFSTQMKEALPLDNTLAFLSQLNSQVGKIVDYELIKDENETFASYKTTFERGVLSLDISIDTDSHISGLLFKPFAEKPDLAKNINILSTDESIISSTQSELISQNLIHFPNNTQISIAIIENGKARFFGVKKLADTLTSIDNHSSVFEIGSVSKVFTSTLLASYAVDDKLALDDNINEYLEIPFNDGVKLSFLELANHTAGLPRLPSNLDLTKVDPLNPYKGYDETKLTEYISEYLELSSRGVYQYSNVGTGLLGFTLGEISNSSYEQLLQDHIFTKYMMTNSTTDISRVRSDIVIGLNNDGQEVSHWEFMALSGAGSILSTVEDLAKFAMQIFDESNKELALTLEKTHKVNEQMDIGLGWHILHSESENNWFWHNGGTGGYSSSMVLDGEDQDGIIILSNVSAFNPNMGNIDKLCFALMHTLNKN